MAHLVRNDLVAHGFDVFMDIEAGQRRVRAGDPARDRGADAFPRAAGARSLDRIGESGDWLRREIAQALAHRRNVVPVLANGARMPLPRNCLRTWRGAVVQCRLVPHDYFAEAMQKLRERFLRMPEPLPTGGHSHQWSASTDRRPGQARALSRAAASPAPLEVSSTRRRWTGRWPRRWSRSATADFAGSERPSVERTPRHILRSDLDRGRFFRVRATATWGFFPGPWSNTVEMR